VNAMIGFIKQASDVKLV